MAEVLPFRGIRFNTKAIHDLTKVLCPPYDLISEKNRILYQKKSPYNIVALESPQPDQNGYLKAAQTLKNWLEKGVLIVEERKSFYLHKHSFIFRGKKYSRLGLIAIVKADENNVLPHENTSPHQIADRLNLLRTCQANFSPILALYLDREGNITKLLSNYVSLNQPILEIEDVEEAHKLWRIDESDILDQLSLLFLPKTIYIADGHHRFKASLIYQKEKHDASYVLMALTEANDPGLLVLPIYRLLLGIGKDEWDKFKHEIGSLFEMKAFFSLNSLKQALERGKIGVFFNGEGYLLIPKGRAADFPTTFHLLNELLIPLLPNHPISYITELDEFDLEDSLLFLTSPLATEEIIRLSLAKITLPNKTTYFYPKIPAGLVFYKWG